ncbi:LodA/GoxA family CTQ-dependent oxidase [Microbacterium sp. B2969]|uniref:LodA/GoxA family CTQ-dependent oxidase n=1 Tax=Microbacterium alkaliflavum TaxID=3248839 RepID=A0ABW7Q550_9MICO
MPTTYRIHPAIGIARVGNSPDEFFIGPERAFELPDPPGGFKDAEGRVKRQAARFRIFAHHDDGTFAEVTDAEAEIHWTVHLVNAKAAHPGRGNGSGAGLVIDPGPRSLTGPDQQALFDSGQITFGGTTTTVPLGEIRTDDEGHLLVLGGHGAAASPTGASIVDFWGNAEWYDDIADGPVEATITLRSDGSTPPVKRAWVVSAPPKFAPQQDSITTLYDRILEKLVQSGVATAPSTTSYTNDIHPILQRARDINWVRGIKNKHAWAEPVTSQPVIDTIRARINPSDMPNLNGGDAEPTSIQVQHLDRWKNGTYVNDWAGTPPVGPLSPDGMDRAALDACVGAAFFPGIEAGGLDATDRPILNLPYEAPFRFAPGVAPGQLSQAMALPWQADFNACGGSNTPYGDAWWPVPRPNLVFPQGQSTYADWTRNLGGDMVGKWHTLGFVVKQGAEHVEVDSAQAPSVTLLTPKLQFLDVPQGPMGMVREIPLAIAFEVIAPAGAVTLEYAPGGEPNHAQLVAITNSVTVGPTPGNSVATARLWIVYRTGAVGSAIPTQTVTVRQAGGGSTWQITIDGNTIARKTAAVALVLDRSGSMSEDRGDGQPKHAAVQDAANAFVDLMLEGDGVGVTRFNEDAQELQPVKALGAGGLSDTARSDTHDVINGSGLDPSGATSIGDGIFVGRAGLTASTPFDTKALVVLTDGVQNQPRWIADVAPEINEKTYAVGLGQPQNISVPALQTISGNNGGYLLVTGAITADNRFRLQKYFLQILSGINNADVVLDPDGVLARGEEMRIPFLLSDADAGIEVVLLTPRPAAVDFRLQTPAGMIIEPWRALSDPTMTFQLGDGTAFYRLGLPVQLIPQRFEQQGMWHVLLTIGKPRVDRPEGVHDGPLVRGDRAHRPVHEVVRTDELRRATEVLSPIDAAPPAALAAAAINVPSRGVLPYSVLVHSYSSIAFEADLDQSSLEPGATVTVRARLAQSGLPSEGASVWAEIVRPDASAFTLALGESESGEHTATFVAGSAGVYTVRVRGRGRTRLGNPFTRERTLTAAVWRGGDRAVEPSSPAGGAGHSSGCGCDVLRCMLENGLFDDRAKERLREQGIDLDVALRCLAKHGDRPIPER